MGRGLSIMGMKRRLLSFLLLACGSAYGANVAFDNTTKNTTPTNLNIKANTIAIGRTNIGGSGSLSLSGGINSPSPSLNPDKNHFIAGGQQHTITSTINDAAIVGGFQNQITAGNYSAIMGGSQNVISSNAVTAFIGAGQQNRVTYNSASIAGLQNAVDGDDSAIIAGNNCLITANSGWAAIIANDTSTITGPGGGDYYCILPGLNNNIPYALSSDDFCYILGGRGNMVTKRNSWVIGMFITNNVVDQIEMGYSDADKIRINATSLSAVGAMTILVNNTVSTSATTGSTINKQGGRVRLSAGNQTYLLTNSYATANSVVIATVSTDDTTALNVKAIPASGLITLKANAATTANTDISWLIVTP